MTEGLSDAPVTVIVTDIEGSTDLQTRLGDAAARDLVRQHEVIVRDALAANAGHEVKTMGDGFLAQFTSTRRALECAAAIQRGVAETAGLRVRIGVHCGEVIQEGGDIHGAAVAAAARIMSQAAGGEILVSDLVRQLAGAAGVRFKTRDRVALKGLEGTWLLHEVEWRDPRPEAADPGPAPSSASSLIGRSAERAVLHMAIDDAIAGRGRLVLLAGEPGIGKTSLAVESSAYGDHLGAVVAWGSCWEGEGAPAFWPWIQVIRACATGLSEDELSTDVGPSAAELCRLVPDLATQLRDVAPPPELDPEQARFRLFDAIASFLCRASGRRPLLIVLDDLHWSDESSMRLLAFVAAQMTTSAVAIVGTYRDTEVGADHPLAPLLHDASRRGQTLPVKGLDAADVARLMTSTAQATLRVELATAVHRQTAGNPLFVGEITRLLASQNALDRDDVSVGVPHGVREVIERRLVRLPQKCIELLTLAAVVGEEFSLDLVAGASGAAMPAAVDVLEPAIVSGVARAASLGRYRFAHALFREVLYEGQGTIPRASLHLQVATALEHRQETGGDVEPAELAHHFLLASLTGETAKAVTYARLAGNHATASLAYAEAVVLFERALQVLDLNPLAADGDRAELILDLSAARWRAGDRAGARSAVEQAINVARRTGRGDVLARAALGLQRLGGMSGTEGNERLRLLEEAYQALSDEDSRLRVRVMAGLAKEKYHAWLHFPESAEGSALAEEAVAMARRLGAAEVLVEALVARHDTLWFTGKEVERLAVARELERVAQEVGDHEIAAEAVLLQSVALLELAAPDAVQRLERFVALADELQTPRFAYLAASRRVTLAMIRGDLDAAERGLAEAAAIAEQHGEPDHINVSAAQMFMVSTLQGRRADAIARVNQAYRYNKAFGLLIDATACLALVDEGRIDAAREKFQTIDLSVAAEDFRNYGWLNQTAVLGEIAAAIGDHDALVQLDLDLRPYADRCIVVAGAVTFLGSVAHYLGLVNQALGRHEQAAADFEQAFLAHSRLGATLWLARTQKAMNRQPEPKAAHELRRDGTAWSITYHGDVAHVKDAKGLRDLAVLLATPGKEVAAVDLMVRDDAARLGADAVLDDRARREFRARLDELDADLTDAETANDLERIAALKAEQDALSQELAGALGLGGRARRLGDPGERARKAVSARIRDAIERIEAEHTELGRHLRAAVQTGTFCSYTPPSPTTWHVTDGMSR